MLLNKDGTLEAAKIDFLRKDHERLDLPRFVLFTALNFHRYPTILNFLRPPNFSWAMFSLLNAIDEEVYSVAYESERTTKQGQLLFPETVVREVNDEPFAHIRPFLGMLWPMSKMEHCPSNGGAGNLQVEATQV